MAQLPVTSYPASDATKFSIIGAALGGVSDAHRAARPTTTSTGNVSDEDRLQYLESLQDDTTTTMIPAMIFLSALMISGIVGNSLVLFVYSQRFTRTSTRVYVLVIAALDIIANVIGIPGEIYDMFHIWDFDNRPLCRARLFFNSFSTLSSAMVLLAVAVTRYRKVCVPYGWQISVRQARIVSLVIVSLGVLFSMPYVILSGRQTKKTSRPDVTGYECTVDDDYVFTIWPLINNGFFLVLFFSCSVPLVVIYIKIGAQAWRHSAIHGSTSTAAGRRSFPANSSSIEHQDPPSKHITKPKFSFKRRKSKAATSSTASEDDNPFSTDISEGQPDRAGNTDNYIVRILEDAVEITTPMMGQFIVQLKKKTSVTGEEELDSVAIAGGIADQTEHADHGNRYMHSVTTETATTKCGPVSPSEKRKVSEFENHAFKIENDDVDMNDKEKAGFSHCSFPPDSLRIPATVVDSQSQSCKSDALLINVSRESLSSNIDNKASEQIVDFVAEDVVPTSLDQTPQIRKHTDISPPVTPGHADPTLALRWVDIVFSPPGQEEAAVPGQSTQHDTIHPQLSFRMSPTNALLQKTEWLRNLISLALAKKKDRKLGDVFICDESELNVNIPRSLSDGNEGDDDVIAKTPSPLPFNHAETPPSKARNLVSMIRSTFSWKNTWRKFSLRGSTKSGRRPLGRTTAMLIFISAFFVAGFIPYLILMFYKLSAPGSYASMNVAEQSVYNLFLRMYFINCAVNPIIYSFCDVNFRKECMKLLHC